MQRFDIRHEGGQTMAEYGVILTVITAGVLAALILFSGAIIAALERVRLSAPVARASRRAGPSPSAGSPRVRLIAAAIPVRVDRRPRHAPSSFSAAIASRTSLRASTMTALTSPSCPTEAAADACSSFTEIWPSASESVSSAAASPGGAENSSRRSAGLIDVLQHRAGRLRPLPPGAARPADHGIGVASPAPRPDRRARGRHGLAGLSVVAPHKVGGRYLSAWLARERPRADLEPPPHHPRESATR